MVTRAVPAIDIHLLTAVIYSPLARVVVWRYMTGKFLLCEHTVEMGGLADLDQRRARYLTQESASSPGITFGGRGREGCASLNWNASELQYAKPATLSQKEIQ